MGWMHEVIAKRECGTPVSATLRRAERTLGEMLERRDDPRLSLRAELFDIASNSRVGEVPPDGRWSWPSGQYLWIAPAGVKGGIDIEVEHVTSAKLSFLGRDMEARNIDLERRAEVMQRAQDGVRYTIRLSFHQPTVMYLTLLALGAALASVSDGYVYTLDADWLSAMAPLSGGALEELLSDKNLRSQAKLQDDVAAAREQMTGVGTPGQKYGPRA